jgi:RHS repeat-associated protein
VHQRRDGVGVETTATRDFNGSVTTVRREVASDPAVDPDWAHPPALDAPLTTTTTYDALKRVKSVTTPDGSVTRPVFNPRSLLDSIGVTPPGAATGTFYVTSVSYDPRGQRLAIVYGNGARTDYTYEPETFRLATLVTGRPVGGSPVQHLTYTYDPVGNVTRVLDAAQSTVFFANPLVAPVGDYTYDVIYRLTFATGREHAGQAYGPDDSPRRGLPLPSDDQAMRNYTEAYTYDLVGNLATVNHQAAGGAWVRGYLYDNGAANPATNRLTSTVTGATTEPYGHDGNGNIDAMPHLASMAWDYRDQVRRTTRQVSGGATPATWYAYDSANLRGRKATTRSDGSIERERLYLGPYERYREYAGDGTVSLERVTVTVPDGDRRLVLLETTTPDGAHPVGPPVTTTRYQFDDRLGSASLELDEHAAVIGYEEYYPFGATSFQAGRSTVEVGLKRYRYTGREHDDETGLAYHGARYYAPWLGRWTACDPAGLVDGTGLYTYARDNPMRLVDPGGTDGDEPDPPGDPAVPSPAAASGASITPPGSSLIGYNASGSLAWPPAAQRSGLLQGLAVVGLTKRLQLQIGAGGAVAGQDTQPTAQGINLSAQLQYNFFDDPAASSHFLVASGSFADLSPLGGPPTLTGGGSVQYGFEHIFSKYDSFNQPKLQLDINAGLGALANPGGLAPGSSFPYLVGPMASAALTLTPFPYYSDALRANGVSGLASSVPPLAVGIDAYVTSGFNRQQDQTGASVTGGVDIFASLVSKRLDSGTGLGNNRIGATLSVGPFLTGDTSGSGGSFVGGWGLRGALTIWFGRGDVPATQRDQQR